MAEMKVMSVRFTAQEHEFIGNKAAIECLPMNTIIRAYVKKDMQRAKKELTVNTNLVLSPHSKQGGKQS